MMCIEYRPFMSATIDGEIPPDQWREAKAHLDRCTGCDQWVRWMNTMDGIIARNRGKSEGDEAREVTEALERLQPETRVPFDLLKLDGLNYDQIGAKLRLRREQVFDVISRARFSLQFDLALLIQKEM